MKNKSIIRIALTAACLLMLPLLAMQLTDQVAWDIADFAVAGVLLFGTGLTYELIARKGGTIAYRVAVAVALAAALLLVWMNLAVGLIRSEKNPANLMYLGVLGVGIAGALIARFRPHGMARALIATASAQAAVAVIALVSAGFEVSLILNGFFVGLWAGSALLFLRAGMQDSVARQTA